MENSSIHRYVFPVLEEVERQQKRLPTTAYNEIGIKIFAKLGARDLSQAELVCKEWKELIRGRHSNLGGKFYTLWERFDENRRSVSQNAFPLQNSLISSPAEKEEYNNTLPDEIWAHIFSYLGGKDLRSCQQACARWDALTTNYRFWKPLLEKSFPLLAVVSEKLKIHPKDQLTAQANIIAYAGNKLDCVKIMDFTFLAMEKGHQEDVQARFSPNGKQIIISSDFHTLNSGIISLWDVNTRKCLLEESSSYGRVGASFSPDSQRLVTFSPDRQDVGKTIRLWDPNTGECLKTLGKEVNIQTACFSPDSQRLVIHDGSKSISLWDAKSGERLLALEENLSWSDDASFSFSPNSQRLLIYDYEFASLWDANTGKCLHTWEEGITGVAATFSPDSQQIAMARVDFICLWDANTGERLHTLTENDTDSELRLFFSPDSQRLIIDNGGLSLWDAKIGTRLITWNNENWYDVTSLKTISFSPNSQRLVIHSHSGERLESIIFLDANTGGCLHREEGPKGFKTFNGAFFSPNGQKLVITSPRALQIWDGQTGEAQYYISVPKFRKAFFSLSSTCLVISDSHAVYLWGGGGRRIVGKYSACRSVSFSPNGGQLLVGLKIFDFFPAKEG
nr:F-box/WD40 repeat-containing protein [Parachlamydia sp. AcF125]